MIEGRGNGTVLLGLVGFGCALLTVVLVVLRLARVIHWPWLWVLAPIWILWATILVVFAIAGLVFLFSRVARR